jgi:hypothetical protein
VLDVRPAAVAGMFYPAEPKELAADLRAYMSAVRPGSAGAGWPKALIVPHAGYMYSGPIAASGYAQLAAGRARIKRVVLLGPTHRVPIRGLALPCAREFATPLGTLSVDQDAAALALTLPQVQRSDVPHALEHSLEVQLPFLQTLIDDFSIVPFAVGDATPDEVAQVIDLLWGGAETLVVVSSDLSHYHHYGQAQRLDEQTAERIAQLKPGLNHEQACGATPINGLLLSAQRHSLHPALLDLRNSGDTAGDKARVVGYAAFMFCAQGVTA